MISCNMYHIIYIVRKRERERERRALSRDRKCMSPPEKQARCRQPCISQLPDKPFTEILVIIHMGSCPDYSRGRLGPNVLHWALMGRTLMGPLGPCGPGPTGPLWAGLLWRPLGPCRPGPCARPLWAGPL